MKNNKLIIWDWNGTLLDDIPACIYSMNKMLTKRNISEINYKRYREIFTFPVKKYYKKLGFNLILEPFEKLAEEYIALYKIYAKESCLHNGAIKILDYFKIKEYKQVIISAMEQKALEKQITDNEVYHYFDDIIGLDNIHANSKIENAKNYFRDNKKINNLECILIGDTYHDIEVSKALNCKCILVNNGHQKLNRIKLYNNIEVLNNLLELVENNIIN